MFSVDCVSLLQQCLLLNHPVSRCLNLLRQVLCSLLLQLLFSAFESILDSLVDQLHLFCCLTVFNTSYLVLSLVFPPHFLLQHVLVLQLLLQPQTLLLLHQTLCRLFFFTHFLNQKVHFVPVFVVHSLLLRILYLPAPRPFSLQIELTLFLLSFYLHSALRSMF